MEYYICAKLSMPNSGSGQQGLPPNVYLGLTDSSPGPTSFFLLYRWEVFLQCVLEGETDFNGYLILDAIGSDPTALLLHLEPEDVAQGLLCTFQRSFHTIV